MSILDCFSSNIGWNTEKPFGYNLSDGWRSNEGNANSFKSTVGLLNDKCDCGLNNVRLKVFHPVAHSQFQAEKFERQVLLF